jgi:adenosylcobinamide-GDP ribazoletransferase
MFKDGLTKRIVLQATGLSIPYCLCLGSEAVLVFLLSLLSGMLFARRISAQLGGLTGDVYGAVVAVSETTVLLLYFLFTYLNLKG